VTAIVSVETVLLVILVVLVAGLLRSHAEVLRRLGPAGASGSPGSAPDASGLGIPQAPERRAGAPAAPIAGTTPDGDAIALDLAAPGGPTLLAFLSSGCSTCGAFWAGLHEARLPARVQPVVVTHGADRERAARLRELAPPGVAVVMSSHAWTDYDVPGSPYFVLVDGAIRGEGVATTWPALSSLVSDAMADAIADVRGTGADGEAGAEAGAGADGRAGAASSGTARALTVERTLAASGIGPDHPSLYPGGRSPQ
jgi:hypothetical protein